MLMLWARSEGVGLMGCNFVVGIDLYGLGWVGGRKKCEKRFWVEWSGGGFM